MMTLDWLSDIYLFVFCGGSNVFSSKVIVAALGLGLLLNVVPALPASPSSPFLASDEFAAYDFVSALAKAKSLDHPIFVGAGVVAKSGLLPLTL
jgi:hypothetical protein